MNIRKSLYFGYHRLTGNSFPIIYEDLVKQDRIGVAPDTTKQLLIQLLTHCQRSVPYYAEIMKRAGGNFAEDPEAYLLNFPILTKASIRENFKQLNSLDLNQRQWYPNTSGGSTGEPAKFIQDSEYRGREMAIQQFYSSWTGAKIGDPEVHIWGSTRDILGGDPGTRIKIAFANALVRRTVLNAFRMSPERIREFLHILNIRRPKLIVAYVEAIYEIARFAEREKITIRPQSAIITTAGPLFPFMREKIEEIFQCKVFDRYGSREVGDIAGDCAIHKGLHVFPYGNYVEVVDDAGNRLPPGQEGNIVVTSLGNYAMPLIRYQIGDRGTLSVESNCACGRTGQILTEIAGRANDVFKTADGTLVDAGYFIHLLFYRPWVEKFQIIQKSYTSLLFKVKKSEHDYRAEELADIINKTKLLMGNDCRVDFEFVADIPNLSSGKYSYTLSEIKQ